MAVVGPLLYATSSEQEREAIYRYLIIIIRSLDEKAFRVETAQFLLSNVWTVLVNDLNSETNPALVCGGLELLYCLISKREWEVVSLLLGPSLRVKT
jgi:hypothetical protein